MPAELPAARIDYLLAGPSIRPLKRVDHRGYGLGPPDGGRGPRALISWSERTTPAFFSLPSYVLMMTREGS